jgi:hypothetical protein
MYAYLYLSTLSSLHCYVDLCRTMDYGPAAAGIIYFVGLVIIGSFFVVSVCEGGIVMASLDLPAAFAV